jgi:hypothetical protein
MLFIFGAGGRAFAALGIQPSARNASTAGKRRLRRAGPSAAKDATSTITVATVSSIPAAGRTPIPAAANTPTDANEQADRELTPQNETRPWHRRRG